MNNYPNFQNYYNYASMNNEVNNSSNNNEGYNLYDPYNGFIRGNLFKYLYDPYKLKVPYDVKPMNKQAELLTHIDTLDFAMIDLNLYLDIYQNNKNAIELYNKYRLEKENLLNQYENQYGPIMLNSNSLNSYPWAWNNMPWPWDN